MIRLSRRHGPELMDRPDVPPADLSQGLADLRQVNRWLGGTRAALRPLLRLLKQIDAPEIRVLDVATGSADVPVALARRAFEEGIRVRILATDLNPKTVAVARANVRSQPGVEVDRANGLALDFAAGEFHVAMCHTAMHHFAERDAVTLLSEMARVASHAVVVTDLRRSPAALVGVRLLGATLWRGHPVTRHDGIVSVRASFTPHEAMRVARQAGLPSLRVERHPLFRFSLVSRLDGEAS